MTKYQVMKLREACSLGIRFFQTLQEIFDEPPKHEECFGLPKTSVDRVMALVHKGEWIEAIKMLRTLGGHVPDPLFPGSTKARIGLKEAKGWVDHQRGLTGR